MPFYRAMFYARMLRANLYRFVRRDDIELRLGLFRMRERMKGPRRLLLSSKPWKSYYFSSRSCSIVYNYADTDVLFDQLLQFFRRSNYL